MLTYPRNFAAQALALTVLTFLTSCTPDGGDESEDRAASSSSARPGDTNRELTEEEFDALEVPTHTKADVAFVQNMIPHHEQALTMTDDGRRSDRQCRPAEARGADGHLSARRDRPARDLAD